MVSSLFRLDARLLDHAGPLIGLRGDVLCELLGRHAQDIGAFELKALLRLGGFDDRGDLALQLAEHRGRRAGRRDDAPPVGRFGAWHAGLRKRRYVGKRGQPVRSADAERAQLSGAHVRHVLHRAADIHGHLTADRVGERRTAALVLDDDDVDARGEPEELGREMLETADPGRAGVELPGLRLGERDQLAHRVGRQRGRHHEQARPGADRRHRHEPLQRFERHRAERDAHRPADRDEEQRVAVGRRLGRGIDADGAAAAAAVVDDHALAEALPELRGDEAPDHVVRAAGREGNDEAHRLRRISLRMRPCCGEREQNGRKEAHRYILAPAMDKLPNYRTDFRCIRDEVSAEEWQARVELAACYRLVDYYGMTDLTYNLITVRVPGPEHYNLIHLYGLLYQEITASSL